MKAQLIPIGHGDPVELTKDMSVVGRKEDCDVRLDHKSVSKMHCVLVKTDGMLFVRDLGSTNGTRVNGTRVRRAGLMASDQLAVASYKYRVHLGPDDPARPVVHEQIYTQQIDAADMRRLKGVKDVEEGNSDPVGPEFCRPNALPDVYPDDEQKKK